MLRFFPTFYLGPKNSRGEAAKNENPIREQGVVGSNPIAPTIQIQPDHEVFVPSENFAGVDSVGGAFPSTHQPVDCSYLLLRHPMLHCGAGLRLSPLSG